MKNFGVLCFFVILLLAASSCQTAQNAGCAPVTQKGKPVSVSPLVQDAAFNEDDYLKIDKIYSGGVYINAKGFNVLYRIIEITEEGNLGIYAENIAVSAVAGKYQLINRFRLNGSSADIPDFGLRLDSLKFIDSVRIQGYFNHKKLKINLDKMSELVPL